jgi:thioredoxin 1
MSNRRVNISPAAGGWNKKSPPPGWKESEGRPWRPSSYATYLGAALTPLRLERKAIMASDKILTVTDDNFEDQVLKSDKPVLVDFWASWCGPCRAVAPVLDQIAEENDKVLIAKLNVDEQQKIAYQFQVSSIPTFILFKDGKMADRMMGAMPKPAFEKFIERNM